jgi:endonuclease/exonuclease/phosphatase family metal-dependent hydrolase
MGERTIKAMGWNVQQGGFLTDGYEEPFPPREENIRRVISEANADALGLVDLFRWNKYYGGDEGIARFLGMQAAFYTALDDERLTRQHPSGADLGVVFATNERVALSEPLDLETRQGNRTVLDIGKYGLQFATLYLDEKYEDIRMRQMLAAEAQLEDMPTIVWTDLNALRPLNTARLSEKARSALLRFATYVLPSSMPSVAAIQEMERREALKVLIDKGFTDGDPKQRPTALGNARVFGVDYIMSRGKGVEVSNFTTLPHQGGSDHLAVSATIKVG